MLHMGRANTCQDQPKKMARDGNALGILKGIALLREREIYYREIRVTERRVSSAKVIVVKGPFASERHVVSGLENAFSLSPWSPFSHSRGKCRS